MVYAHPISVIRFVMVQLLILHTVTDPITKWGQFLPARGASFLLGILLAPLKVNKCFISETNNDFDQLKDHFAKKHNFSDFFSCLLIMKTCRATEIEMEVAI